MDIGKIYTNISSVKVKKSNGLQYKEVSNTSEVIYWKKSINYYKCVWENKDLNMKEYMKKKNVLVTILENKEICWKVLDYI